MNTILMLAHDDDGQEARLCAALDLARAWGGHLACMDIIAPVASSWSVHDKFAAADLLVDECLRITANKTRLKARLARENIAWNWIDGSGFLGDSLPYATDLADLVIVSLGRNSNASRELGQLVEYLVTKRRGAVLAVPHDLTGLDITGTALVVCDKSRPGDEALAGTARLLKSSREVVLFDIDNSPDDRPNCQRASARTRLHLAEHGIHAIVHAAQRRPGATCCTAVRDHAHELDAACIVLVAADDPPTNQRETMRSMLAQCDRPLFIVRG